LQLKPPENKKSSRPLGRKVIFRGATRLKTPIPLKAEVENKESLSFQGTGHLLVILADTCPVFTVGVSVRAYSHNYYAFGLLLTGPFSLPVCTCFSLPQARCNILCNLTIPDQSIWQSLVL